MSVHSVFYFYSTITDLSMFFIVSGEKGVGATTGKPLHFKGSNFHRIIQGFMAQVLSYSLYFFAIFLCVFLQYVRWEGEAVVLLILFEYCTFEEFICIRESYLSFCNFYLCFYLEFILLNYSEASCLCSCLMLPSSSWNLLNCLGNLTSVLVSVFLLIVTVWFVDSLLRIVDTLIGYWSWDFWNGWFFHCLCSQ